MLFDSNFWNTVVNFKHLADTKLINAKDLELFTMADTPQGAWDALVKRGLKLP